MTKVCVNAHDFCYGGAGGPCPYCETRPRKHTKATAHTPPVDSMIRLEKELEAVIFDNIEELYEP